MARHRGLRQVERFVDIADANLAGREQRQDPQTGPGAKRLEEFLEVGQLVGLHVRYYIRLDEYMPALYIRVGEYIVRPYRPAISPEATMSALKETVKAKYGEAAQAVLDSNGQTAASCCGPT